MPCLPIFSFIVQTTHFPYSNYIYTKYVFWIKIQTREFIMNLVENQSLVWQKHKISLKIEQISGINDFYNTRVCAKNRGLAIPLRWKTS